MGVPTFTQLPEPDANPAMEALLVVEEATNMEHMKAIVRHPRPLPTRCPNSVPATRF